MRCNFIIVESTPDKILLRDIGPWNQYITITNDAEAVVERFFPELKGRQLLYYDSDGKLGELLIEADGTFYGYGEIK